jgi:hypothetical protein
VVQGTFLSGAQDHAGCSARLEYFLPTGCTEAPTVAGFQAAKAECRYRCRKIVAALPRSSCPVLQQPSRKNPVMGFIEQTSSRSPSTMRGVSADRRHCRRRPSALPSPRAMLPTRLTEKTAFRSCYDSRHTRAGA